jgi:bacterial/archaeal transporter family protein
VSWFHWALLSAVFAGLTAVLAKVGVKDVDANVATAIRTVVILVFAWAIALAGGGREALLTVPRKAWLFLVLSGLATGASWLCYFRALQKGEASKVAPVDKLSVVVAMVLAVVFLGERLTWQHWVGGGLIVSGTIVLAYV